MCVASLGCGYFSIHSVVKAAIQNGADFARNGKGTIYLFSAGNEALYGGIHPSSVHHNPLNFVNPMSVDE
jgi:hypothetical protein